MKIDRLMGILTVLLRSPGVTAPELAERFEVSRRTITRDMEALCRAGVPIVSRQGAGGGFSVQPGYRVPDDLFTRQELRTLLAAAQGVDSLSGGENAACLRSRVPEGEADWIEIDLAGQSPRIKQLFPQLRDADFGGKLRAHRLLRAGERRNARGGAASPRLQMGRVVSDRVVQAAAGFPSVQAGADRALRNIGGAL